MNSGFFTTVAARIPVTDRARLARLLLVDPVARRSEFDRLKAPAKAASLGKFRQRLNHLAALDSLGATEVWLAGVPPGKVGHFAGEARVTDVADFRKYGEDKRLTLLVSLIHVLRTAARDEVCDMFCKRIAAIHKRGRERLDDLREQHRAESERLLGVFGDVLGAAREVVGPADVPDDGTGVAVAAGAGVFERAGQLMLKVLDAGGGVEQLSAAHEAVAAHHGNNYLPLLGTVLPLAPQSTVHTGRFDRARASDRGSRRARRGGVRARGAGPARGLDRRDGGTSNATASRPWCG